ncbi:MAG TPA: AAA domain-containing protein, partial [Flavisolibacter sp.]|nr:AAA domain-containing protein [Flavisolibacter sp.]
MDYFKSLLDLLNIEKTEDRRQYEQLTSSLSVPERRANGMTWYPIAIKGTELDRADYLTVEVERTSHQDVIHQFRFGASAALFSNHDPRNDRVEGTVSYLSGDRLSITLRTDELPEWSRNGKLGIDLVFDEISYGEMEKALKLAPVIAEKKEEGKLIRILTGAMKPSFNDQVSVTIPTLNAKQQDAVSKIMAANELAVVHGPPGTGKTTTIVQA